MRITRENLHKIARDTAERAARRSRSLICIYLTGSLLSDNPLLGGTTDIDLVYVHNSEPPLESEITRLSDEVSLDIAHYSQSAYHPPRKLRVDPWLGAFLVNNPIVLHDVAHWFEFTQASAGANFSQPETIIDRARQLAGLARQAWLEMPELAVPGSPRQMLTYLKCLKNAANALASLSGVPLTDRRFMLEFPARAAALNRPGLAGGLLDLLMPTPVPPATMDAWRGDWAACMTIASESTDVIPALLPARLPYYLRAAEALSADQPAAALWFMLRTWTRALDLPGDWSAHLSAWQAVMEALDLSAADFDRRYTALDSYLDAVEETLDDWADLYGV